MEVLKNTALTLGSEINRRYLLGLKLIVKIIFITSLSGSLEWNLFIDVSASGDSFVIMLLKAAT